MEENKGNRQGYKIEGPVEDLVYKKGYIGKTPAIFCRPLFEPKSIKIDLKAQIQLELIIYYFRVFIEKKNE